MDWFKFHADFAFDSRVQKLGEEHRCRLVQLMCLQCANQFHDIAGAAYIMHIDEEDLRYTVELLCNAGVTDSNGIVTMWALRDVPKTNAERQADFRKRQKDLASKASDLNSNEPNSNESNAARNEVVTIDKIREEENREDKSRSTPIAAQPSVPTAKRGTRIPVDWQLSEELFNWALQEKGLFGDGRDRTAIERMASNFYDYWSSKAGAGATKMDWDKTWKNWVRNDRTIKPNHAPQASEYDRVMAEYLAGRQEDDWKRNEDGDGPAPRPLPIEPGPRNDGGGSEAVFDVLCQS